MLLCILSKQSNLFWFSTFSDSNSSYIIIQLINKIHNARYDGSWMFTQTSSAHRHWHTIPWVTQLHMTIKINYKVLIVLKFVVCVIVSVCQGRMCWRRSCKLLVIVESIQNITISKLSPHHPKANRIEFDQQTKPVMVAFATARFDSVRSCSGFGSRCAIFAHSELVFGREPSLLRSPSSSHVRCVHRPGRISHPFVCFESGRRRHAPRRPPLHQAHVLGPLLRRAELRGRHEPGEAVPAVSVGAGALPAGGGRVHHASRLRGHFGQ